MKPSELTLRERSMLLATSTGNLTDFGPGELVVVISPTRGAMLAEVGLDSYASRKVFVRKGSPPGLIEESPDVLHDAKAFLAIDSATRLITDLRNALSKARAERDEARNDVEAYRGMKRRVYAQLVTARAERDLARRELELLRSQHRKH